MTRNCKIVLLHRKTQPLRRNVEIQDLTPNPDLGQPIDEHGVLIAHPLIVYAELMAGDDVRLGETALRLKEQHLSWIA
ncbi:type IV toxin-antitoxin system AbiEi family antitoxin, partial [Candidatus Bipolaricaulota bacterium]|nr:type IV toxin-antitoxin system AbiEi family antitoxin [Candidatus Bipolaricaulota bacterium]